MIRGILLVLGVLSGQASAQLPDIATVEPDLVVPELSEGKPAVGKRVKPTMFSIFPPIGRRGASIL